MKKNKLPSLISILVLTLVTSIIWIALSVYRAFTSKAPESVPQAVSAPLTPTLDQSAIKQIESGLFLTGSQIPETVATSTLAPAALPTLAPVPTPTPISTQVASPSATP